MDTSKKMVEHYRDHEIVCRATLVGTGWSYSISIVSHTGDESEVAASDSEETYTTDLDALLAAKDKAKRLVDEMEA